MVAGDGMGLNNTTNKRESEVKAPKRGMVLPFQPLSLAFNHLNYYVDMPLVSIFFGSILYWKIGHEY